MNETLKRINLLLKSFNDTFEVEAEITQEGDEIVASKLRIKNLKNDGHDFINVFYNTFNSIVQGLSDDHEVIYNEERGIVIAKRVIKTDYIIDDF